MSDVPPPSTADAWRDRAAARLEDRLKALEDLREMSLRLARTLEARVLAEAATDADDSAAEAVDAADADGAGRPTVRKSRDPIAAFASLARAVRLTVMLETRTDEDLARLMAGAFGAPRTMTELTAASLARAAADAAPAYSAEDSVARGQLVETLIEEHIGEAAEGDDGDRLYDAIQERLERDGTFGDGRPPGETVKALWQAIRTDIEREWPLTPTWWAIKQAEIFGEPGPSDPPHPRE
jgi:hypothetical protein